MSSFFTPRRVAICSFLILASCMTACQRGRIGEEGDAPSVEDLVSFYSPRSIKVLPFTKPRSFDDDAIPDGIGVSLRPLDQAGDPVKAYGTFLFELYAFQNAIGGHKGELLQTWNQPILSAADQKQFWERVTSTYEFQLSWEGKPLPPQMKYILVASFESPGSDRLFDEYHFEFRVLREEIMDALAGQQQPADQPTDQPPEQPPDEVPPAE